MLEEDEIKGLLKSDREVAIASLYDTYYPLLYKTAYYVVKDQEEAKDLVQELFVKLWSSPEQLSSVLNYKYYLTTLVKNLALDSLRKTSNAKKTKESYLSLQWDPSYHMEAKNDGLDELKLDIERFVSELPPKCRLIFALNRFEGLTNSEIADYLDLSPRTVEKQISIALRTLRAQMGSKSSKLLQLTFSLII